MEKDALKVYPDMQWIRLENMFAAGVPDIVFTEGGITLWIEAKWVEFKNFTDQVKIGLSLGQKIFFANLLKAGGYGIIAVGTPLGEFYIPAEYATFLYEEEFSIEQLIDMSSASNIEDILLIFTGGH